MAGGGEEDAILLSVSKSSNTLSQFSIHYQNTYLLSLKVLWLETRIELLPKLTRRILPDLAISIRQPVLLLREPVGLIRACFGHEVDFEAGVAEDVVGVESFGYEEAYVTAR